MRKRKAEVMAKIDPKSRQLIEDYISQKKVEVEKAIKEGKVPKEPSNFKWDFLIPVIIFLIFMIFIGVHQGKGPFDAFDQLWQFLTGLVSGLANNKAHAEL
eukprot:TRINITY_DN6874_c0_g1_i3.p1 TRINITY_DN6874_c0_g1~~TRINITY_DN6874_c0_g1_i3.p1  ORF type:complete len:101 (+),score=24.78 TRINITY_DN6874_c0_g1_i3:111-413(+)